MNRLVYNAIKTPDGTILHSKNVHDYVQYTDTSNGKYYAVDGGTEYQKLVLDENAPYEDICLYENDDFEIIRKTIVRANRGIDGKLPLTYVKLCDMDHNWLLATIRYNHFHGLSTNVFTKMYVKEVEYRLHNNLI